MIVSGVFWQQMSHTNLDERVPTCVFFLLVLSFISPLKKFSKIAIKLLLQLGRDACIQDLQVKSNLCCIRNTGFSLYTSLRTYL